MVRSCNPGTRRLEASPGWGSGHNGAAGGSYLSRPHLQVPMSNLLAVDRTDKIVKSDAARRAQLTPERYRIGALAWHRARLLHQRCRPGVQTRRPLTLARHTSTPMPDVAPAAAN